MSTYQTNAKYRERHKENNRSRYRNETPEQRARRTTKNAAWREKNAESYRLASQRSTLLRRYGITPEQRDAMFEAQGRRCACCGSVDPGSAKGFAIDHDHESGKVRGILCQRCNRLLGWLGDTESRLRARFVELLAYLESAS